MENSKREILKQKLSLVNAELRIHGGNDNKIKLSKLNENQLEFLFDLFHAHLEKYSNEARKKLEEFHYEDIKTLSNYKMVTHIHSLQIPNTFEEKCKWKLTIGRTRFGSTEVIIELEGWKIVNATLVG